MSVTIEQARAAKEAARAAFSELGSVVGIGIIKVGDDFGLKVSLKHEPPSGLVVPKQVQGVPVVLEISEPVIAYDL
jgi:hypothetical protein